MRAWLFCSSSCIGTPLVEETLGGADQARGTVRIVERVRCLTEALEAVGDHLAVAHLPRIREALTEDLGSPAMMASSKVDPADVVQDQADILVAPQLAMDGERLLAQLPTSRVVVLEVRDRTHVADHVGKPPPVARLPEDAAAFVEESRELFEITFGDHRHSRAADHPRGAGRVAEYPEEVECFAPRGLRPLIIPLPVRRAQPVAASALALTAAATPRASASSSQRRPSVR